MEHILNKKEIVIQMDYSWMVYYISDIQLLANLFSTNTHNFKQNSYIKQIW